jgi:DNA-binding response OmpR family regulator
MTSKSKLRPTALIIDDELDLLDELKETMCSNGFDVDTVSDPTDAVATAARTRPDIVLLDLRMRGRDGYDIACELSRNAQTATIPIITMSGCYSDEERDRLRALGTVKALLTKPFLVSGAMAKIKEIGDARVGVISKPQHGEQ